MDKAKSGGDAVSYVLHIAAVAVVDGDHKNLAGLPGGGEHCGGLAGVKCRGFFHHHVFACAKRRDGDGLVKPVGKGDAYAVNLLVLEEVPVICMEVLDAVLGAVLVKQVGIEVRQGRDLDVGGGVEAGQVVFPKSESYYAYTYLPCHLHSPWGVPLPVPEACLTRADEAPMRPSTACAGCQNPLHLTNRPPPHKGRNARNVNFLDSAAGGPWQRGPETGGDGLHIVPPKAPRHPAHTGKAGFDESWKLVYISRGRSGLWGMSRR